MNDQTLDLHAFVEHIEPTWFQELASGLAIRSHFVVSGNFRDWYPVGSGGDAAFVDFESAVWRVISAEGCEALLIHDPVEGLRLHGECAAAHERTLHDCGIVLGAVAKTPDEIADLAWRVASEGRLSMALLLDYVSTAIRQRTEDVERLFVAMDKAGRGPAPVRPRPGGLPRNPIFWMVDKRGDMPDWFATRNATVRELIIGMPDLSDRVSFTHAAQSRLAPPDPPLSFEERQATIEQFAIRCEGMSLRDMDGVTALAAAKGYGVDSLTEALRNYRLGTTRNPWTSGAMRARVRNAKTVLENRVKGQPRALERTLDILVRSIMGLSGAQTTNRGSRPRGVLFFVGPTGVGKTELAKAVAEVMFGDESAMQRFDMSEFMAEASVSRLTGPPPGAPGHENGGELVNAVRAKPFSVLLFDEIEKAHPRILDAFLQVLDDGRLTDQRGETAFFSEAVIIFTSNIGMTGGDRAANGGMRVLPSDTPDVMEEKLTRAVGDHFRFELRRPELMNRFGQNIVPFEFINPKSAAAIFDAIVRRVMAAVFDEHGVQLTMTKRARNELLNICTFELNDGGRGIGNRIEHNLINPLSRLLFRRDGVGKVKVTGIDTSEREPQLVVEEMVAGGAGPVEPSAED